jgi:hypothetical protein
MYVLGVLFSLGTWQCKISKQSRYIAARSAPPLTAPRIYFADPLVGRGEVVILVGDLKKYSESKIFDLIYLILIE